MRAVITSVDNARVKAARALHRPRRRREAGLCLLEGVRLLETALEAGASMEHVFFTPDLRANERGHRLLRSLKAAGVVPLQVSRRVMARVSSTETTQGIVAVAKTHEADDEAAFRGETALLVADEIADPGNMGTMVRTAAATGAALWTTAGSTDVYDPKALRASVGTVFLTPHRQRMTPAEVITATHALGQRLIVTDTRGAQRYDTVDWRTPFALVIGNEAHGVADELLAAAAATVYVPLRAGVESLNAAITAAVCLFEAERQRSVGSSGAAGPGEHES